MIKKVFLALILSLPLFAQHITGSGTSEDPYLLYTPAHFDSIRYLGSTNKYYKLAADLDFSSWGTFTHIDTATSIDGDGHIISNMTIDPANGIPTSGTYSYHGMFAYSFSYNFLIRNITFYQCSLIVTSPAASRNSVVGLLIARQTTGRVSNVIIKKCYLSYNDNSSTDINGYTVGFITGRDGMINNSVIMESKLICNVDDNSSGEVGLFAGAVYNLTAGFQKNYTYKNYMYLNNSGTSYVKGGFLTGSFDTFGNCRYNFTFKDTLEIGSNVQFGGLAHTISKGGIMGDNPVLSQSYTTGVFLNPNSSIYCDVYYIYMSSYTGYYDTTSHNQWYSGAGARSTSQFQDSTQLPSLDFTSVWDHDKTGLFDGYPVFQAGMVYPSPKQKIEFLNPNLYEEILPGDSLFVSVKSEYTDSIALSYSTNNGISWISIETYPIENDIDTLNTYLTFSESDTLLLRAETEDGTYDISNPFITLSHKVLNIISPSDSSGAYSINDTIDIMIEIGAIDSISLYYAVDNPNNWIPIVLNMSVTYGAIDTITYRWSLPDVHGSIWIRALDVADTILYNFSKSVTYIGGTMASQPLICWYDSDYFGAPLNWLEGSKTWVTQCYVVDATCGWGYYGTRSFGAWLNDDASSYTFGYDPTGYITATQIAANPYIPGNVYIYNAVDTTRYSIGAFYEFGDTITYKTRRYYISSIDTTLRCDDLRNNINNIFVADLKTASNSTVPVIGGWQNSIISAPLSQIYLQIYNVQQSKIIDKYYPITQNFESLNDPLFKPVILIGGPSASGRGSRIVTVEALNSPPDQDYVEDIQRIFVNLNMTKDFFRGIDPKARKKNR